MIINHILLGVAATVPRVSGQSCDSLANVLRPVVAVSDSQCF